MRRLWDLHKHVYERGLHPDDLTFRLVLTCGELLDSFPYRNEILRHLLYLLRVEEGSGRRSLRHGCPLLFGAGR